MDVITEHQQFAEDVRLGLMLKEKRLPSKYFYDDQGSEIFQQIMALKEYYLTDCEANILQKQSADIYNELGFDGHFDIVELGAGDGQKTLHLLRFLLAAEVDFTYIPIDISGKAVEMLQRHLLTELPNLSIKPQVGDYHQLLTQGLIKNSGATLLLFLGSNIGNYHEQAAYDLTMLFYDAIKYGDKLLIGMDLKKNPWVIQQAYSDSKGVTSAFNLNLLTRLNRELSANFDLTKFDFYCHYNPITGAVKSYLCSLYDQCVYIAAIGETVHFKQHELISTELSQKYSLADINTLASKTHFTVIGCFLDDENYFSDSLWVK